MRFLVSLFPSAVAISSLSRGTHLFPQTFLTRSTSRSLSLDSPSPRELQFQHLDSGEVDVTWPTCSSAKSYRIISKNSNEKKEDFKLFSTVSSRMKLQNLESDQSYLVSVTPIDDKGEELLPQKVSKILTTKVC